MDTVFTADKLPLRRETGRFWGLLKLFGVVCLMSFPGGWDDSIPIARTASVPPKLIVDAVLPRWTVSAV